MPVHTGSALMAGRLVRVTSLGLPGGEALVVEQARLGDKAAFERLVSTYQTPIYNLCYRMLGEAAEAEDATQETFLRVFLHLACYDPRRGFRPWLYAVASHFCIDRLRRQHLLCQSWDAERLYPEAPDTSAAPGSEQTVLQEEGRLEIQTLLAGLSPRERQILAMRYWGDMSCAEIGSAMALSTGAIKSCLHRARLKLAAHWRRQSVERAGGGN